MVIGPYGKEPNTAVVTSNAVERVIVRTLGCNGQLYLEVG